VELQAVVIFSPYNQDFMSIIIEEFRNLPTLPSDEDLE
jgi:hypothetical protein